MPPQLKELMTVADEFADSDGLVFKGERVVVPVEARAAILQRIHSSHGSEFISISRNRDSFLPWSDF